MRMVRWCWMLGLLLVCGPGVLQGQVVFTSEALVSQATTSDSSELGRSVALRGGLLVSGNPGAFNPYPVGFDVRGRVLVHRWSGTGWTADGVLAGMGTPHAPDSFGFAVATDGTRIAVGAPKEYDSTRGTTGAVYVFVHTGSEWTLEQRLTVAPSQYGAEFGWRVALDGAVLAVGDPTHQRFSQEQSRGLVHVFEFSAGVWSLEATLEPPDAGLFPPETTDQRFGESLALSGHRLAVGTPGAKTKDAFDRLVRRGSVSVFERGASGWMQTGLLRVPDVDLPEATGSDSGPSQDFGVSVALQGPELFVGMTTGRRMATGGTAHGAVYWFRETGCEWHFAGRVVAGYEAPIGTGSNEFGAQVSVDWPNVLVVSPRESLTAGASEVGVASVWSWDGGTTMSLQGRLLRPEMFRAPAAGALAGDLLAVGLRTSPPSGFQGSVATARAVGLAAPVATAPAGPCDPMVVGGEFEIEEYFSAEDANLDPFGSSVALVRGEVLLVGSPSRGATGNDYRGVVEVYHRSGTAWTSVQQLRSQGPSISADRFGEAIAVDGVRAAITALWEDHPTELGRKGSVAIFSESSPGGPWIRSSTLYAPASATAAEDGYGASVALHGQFLAVGAPDFSPPNQGKPGRVFVYRVQSGAWTLVATLDPPVRGSKFGHSVSLWGDRLAVGMPGLMIPDFLGNLQLHGGVVLYEWNGTNWVLDGIALVPEEHRRKNQKLGHRVALAGDHLFASMPMGRLVGSANLGAVYWYERQACRWVARGELTAPHPRNVFYNDHFGESLSVDWPSVAVGIPQQDDRGQVAVFTLDTDGRFKPALTSSGPAGRFFGHRVALGNGHLAVTSMRSRSGGSGEVAVGRAKNLVPSRNPEQRAGDCDHVVIPGDVAQVGSFGQAVATWGDRVFIGSPMHVASRSYGFDFRGVVRIHQRDGGLMPLEFELGPSLGTPQSRAHFGQALAVNDDWLLVSAPGTVHDTGERGAIHVYRPTPTGWQELDLIMPPLGDRHGRFGQRLLLAGETLVVSDPALRNAQGEEVGAIFVYQHDGTGFVLKSSAESDPLSGLHVDQRFGEALALHDDLLAVGFPGEEMELFDGTRDRTGAVRLFDLDSDGMLSSAGRVALPVAQRRAGMSFGDATAFRDGQLLVGARMGRKGEPGATREPNGALFAFDDTGTSWTLATRYTSGPDDADQTGWFGRHLMLSGNEVLVASPRDERSGPSAGRVFRLADDGSGLAIDRQFDPGTGLYGGRFGDALAVGQELFAVAAPGADNGRGMVYVYSLTGEPFVPPDGEAPSYVAIPLGSLGGQIEGAGLNNLVMAVGGVEDLSNGGIYTGFRHAGEFEVLASPAAFEYSNAYGVNNLGITVGIRAPDYDAWEQYEPVLWETDGTQRVLESLVLGGAATPAAINDGGVAVGEAMNADGYRVPVRWTAAGVIESLPMASDPIHGDAIFGGASAINSAGDIGGWMNAPDSDNAPFVWVAGSSQPTRLPGAGSVNAINDSGRIAGTSNYEGGSFLFSMVHWRNGKRHIIGTLPGGGYSFASDINSDGLIVGGSGLPGTYNQHAVLWKSQIGLIDLNAHTANLGDLRLETAAAINDNGYVLCNAVDALGYGQLVLLVPRGLDEDGDGVDSATEWAAGDANGDGVPDFLQPNVASLPEAADLPRVTLEASAGLVLRNVTRSATAVPEPPGGTPFGVIGFEVHGVAPGGTVEVDILHDPALVPPTQYWKLGPPAGGGADAWYKFAEIGTALYDTPQPGVIRLRLTDGGLGDNDGVADGVIRDPGAPMLITPLLVDLLRFEVVDSQVGHPIRLEWETAGEFDNVGFHVYRAIPDGAGSFARGARLTTQIIPAEGSPIAGAVYRFADELPLGIGEHRGYVLEDVDVHGTTRLHGPAAAIGTANLSSVPDWLLAR